MALLAAVPGSAGAVPSSAGAITGSAGAITGSAGAASDSSAPVLVTSPDRPPPGYRLTAARVRRIAAGVGRIRAELRRHPGAIAYEYTKGPGRWQVSWFSPGRRGTELAQVYLEDANGRVTETWTGFQVAWTMARGYPGEFGRHANAWYVWIPLCVLFLAPFLPLRLARSSRWRASLYWERPSLLHLDLLMLLGFSISLAFFNHALIGISVPLAYPFLLYLLVRMLLLAFGRGVPRRPPELLVPVSWLVVAVVFLTGFRVGLDMTDSNVIDVGYAGVVGAHRLTHGKPLSGGWPQDISAGDTYGPVNYLAYVPAVAIFGWSGHWDDLPAAHAAAIAFDLLTMLGLYLLGRRIRGPTLGVLLAYAWAAYPFTILALSSNSNDSLVAMVTVLALLVVSSAPARGVAGALVGLTKFAPLALAPLLLRGTGGWPRPRSLALYVVAYGLTALAVMSPVLLEGNLTVFWRHTLAYQAGRGSPFSIWGLWGGLGPEQHLVQGAAVALAVALAFVPRRRTLVQLAALGAAVVIAVQLGLTHWFYLYIPWFFPLVMVALLGSGRGRGPQGAPEAREGGGDREDRHYVAPGAGRHYVAPGAGSSTCSIDSARIDPPVAIKTPLSHGSSVEVSNLTGI